MTPSRRSFITGLVAFAAAPAIVRASSLMPVKAIRPDEDIYALLAQRIRECEAVTRQNMATIIYGTDEAPVIFSGFKPLVQYPYTQLAVRLNFGRFKL